MTQDLLNVIEIKTPLGSLQTVTPRPMHGGLYLLFFREEKHVFVVHRIMWILYHLIHISAPSVLLKKSLKLTGKERLNTKGVYYIQKEPNTDGPNDKK